MLPALLLAGVCAFMPDFGATGVVCTPANQAVECRCGECIVWDVHPQATSYQIKRTAPDGSSRVMVRSDESSYNEDGVLLHYLPAAWCPAADDEAMPVEGVTYSYDVAACNGMTCTPYTGVPVKYTAAPYAYTFRPPVKGN